jgi:purine-binding chemotaxis protein CheW
VSSIESETGSSRRCLLVRAGAHECALPLERVRRVVRALKVHPLPGAAPELLGLAEFAGEPLPVLDLASLIGAPPGGAGTAPVTVIVAAGRRGGTELVGLAAEAALDIAMAPADGLPGGDRGLVAGESLVEGRPVRVLDLAALGATR